MADEYAGHGKGLDSPAFNAFDLTPNDGADLATFTRFIHVGSAGNLNVILAGDVYKTAAGDLKIKL